VSAPLLSSAVDVEILVLVMRVRDMVGEVVTVVPRTNHSNSAPHKQRLECILRKYGLLGFNLLETKRFLNTI
jgi:hypothetical protein